MLSLEGEPRQTSLTGLWKVMDHPASWSVSGLESQVREAWRGLEGWGWRIERGEWQELVFAVHESRMWDLLSEKEFSVARGGQGYSRRKPEKGQVSVLSPGAGGGLNLQDTCHQQISPQKQGLPRGPQSSSLT